MPHSIHALTAAGSPVLVSPAAVLALMPDKHDDSRTTLVVDGQLLSTDGVYEDWMQAFATAWTDHAI